MKQLITTAVLLFSATAFAQVGINNTSPKATLDITPKTTDGSKPEGLLIPQLDGNTLKAAAYGTTQKGVIVYAKSAASPTDAKTINVTAEGYYYYDGGVWQKIVTGSTLNTALTSGNIYVGNASNVATAVAPTGDVTISNTGVTSIGSGKVTSSQIADGTVANADLNSGVGGIYKGDGSLSANTTVTQGTSTLAFTSSASSGTSHFTVDGSTLNVDAANDRVGIGTSAPSAKLELNSGTSNTSGLKFTNLSSTSPSTTNASTLGVDASGNVVVQSAAPVQTKFKSFTIDSNVATNSLVSMGSVELRFSGTCTNNNSYVQMRSASGANNVGIFHGAFTDNQTGSGFVNVLASTLSTTFSDLTAYPLKCIDDGHTQFSFFSYTDRTYYRVNVHIADGDNLGFGALGYIYVEYQK